VDVVDAGALNLVGFVRGTAGREGSSADLRGGVGVAGPVPVAHAYVDAAVPTDLAVPARTFLDEAVVFFESVGRSFILWVPSSATSLMIEANSRGLPVTGGACPAMVTTRTVGTGSTRGPRLVLATNGEDREVFGGLCERGYQQTGMAWLMARQQVYSAPDSFWHIAFDGDVPVSAACGFRTGDTGGIYSVATPPEFRGRGFGAAVTAAATNHLFDLGVERVVLQASESGYHVYERLGFTTYGHYERFAVSPAAASAS
jgi:ribosomal protein S18 acetylase RimI-like enzyme